MKRCLTSLFLLALIGKTLACAQTSVETETPQTAPEASPTAEPLPAPTALPETTLTVCMKREPNSLYPFGELNDAARTVLSAVYDGAIDYADYQYQPVILSSLPTLENGDAQISPLKVRIGDTIVNADGDLTQLNKGVKIRPAGCRSADCAIAYDGVSALEMDQMIATFRLLPDLTWSDGSPLVADDSIYAFELQKKTAPDSYRIRRTQTYEAADSQTVQWFGAPGYVDSTYFLNFWNPAPRHAWNELPAEQLSSAEISSRSPLGWGAYRVKEWRAGEDIILEKNPYYFRAAEGYPKIDNLRFRFIAAPEDALSEFVAKRCDILDPSLDLDENVGFLQALQTSEQARFFATPGMSMEWLALGINPASYDDGYDATKDRPNFFADVYVRQALAYCTDRQTLAASVLHGLTQPPASYLPLGHPALDANLSAIPHDPEIGKSLLAQAGWLADEDNPSAPRRAVNILKIANNTPLILNYVAASTTQRRQVAAVLKESLAECGIGVNVEFLSADDLYAPGPDGVLFGRNFDLAEYALGADGFEPPCDWFASASIPNAENSWQGVNLSGFKNDEYDAACLAGRFALQGNNDYLSAYRRTQNILADQIPAIPLFSRLRIAVVRPDLCGFTLDPTADLLWNVEEFSIGESCQN
ncbi:MAG: ABC transporter substrate-binding protein [Anaerolineales bacterium]|nr:ABC transporter substrate-binding protein [Anaerolineales bacterium]